MFVTIEKNISGELIEKKSKFICNIYYVETKKEAENKLKEVKKKYFDARHNCSAYRVIENEEIIEKSSDDGEPSGTAGGPMLNILQKNNLCNVLVVVTRYFGGILLGTGGLVRAYSNVTLNTIQKAEKTNMYEGEEYNIEVSYSNIENIKYYCRNNEISIINFDYLGNVFCTIYIKKEDVAKFLNDIEKRKINIISYKKICDRLIKLAPHRAD